MKKIVPLSVYRKLSAAGKKAIKSLAKKKTKKTYRKRK